MVFTGVRLSWVAFRLGAMINYEFSNLLHNEVTPSNPIKKNHRDLWLFFFFCKYIFSRYFVSFSWPFTNKEYVFFSLKKKKNKNNPPMLAFAAFQEDGDFLCVHGDSGLGLLGMVFRPVAGHTSVHVAIGGIRSARQVSVLAGWPRCVWRPVVVGSGVQAR